MPERFIPLAAASSDDAGEPAPKGQARHIAGRLNASLLFVALGGQIFPRQQIHEQLTQASHDLQTAAPFA